MSAVPRPLRRNYGGCARTPTAIRRCSMGQTRRACVGSRAADKTALSRASMSAAPSPTFLCSTRRAGRIASVAKVPSTQGRPVGRASSPDCISGAGRGFRGDIATVVHGTTVGTNALLERKGARTGIITTQGLPRRARNAPPRPADHLGPERIAFDAGGGTARPAPGSGRAGACRRFGAHEAWTSRRRAKAQAAGTQRDAGCESALRRFSSTRYANADNERARGRGRALRLAEHRMLRSATRKFCPEIREFERRLDSNT